MAEQTPAEKPERWGSIGGQMAAGAIDHFTKLAWVKWITANLSDLLMLVASIIFKLGAPLGTSFAKAIAAAEDTVAPELAEIAAAAVSDAFGVDIPPSTFTQKRNRGGRTAAADSLGAGVINTFKGAGGPLEPSDIAAKRYLTMVLNMGLEGWYQGFVFEFLSSMFPKLEIGQIESFAELDDTIAQILGLGRITRSVLRPLVDATVVTPLKWHTNKTYRPELLSPADVVRQVLRGKWTKAEGVEELARQGYSDKRIEALFNAARKMFGPSDVRQFLSREEWTHDQALQHLKDQGYDEQTASDALRLEGLKRFDQLEGQEAAIIITAYAARDIDRGTFGSLLDAHVSVAAERALYTELAELRRLTNVKHLSLSQVEQMVKSGVANVRDYRDAAEREGYDDEAVTLLELQLRAEVDTEKAIEQHRRELEEARAQELAAKAAALAARKAEVEKDRALARRGAEADLERAVVRGLIPIARLEEVYAARYDADTAAILVGLVEDDRARYVAQQTAADDARKRGARRSLDAGAVTAAFMQRLLTRDELRGRLEAIGFDAADAELLTATAAGRLEALDAAQQQHDAAAAAAKRRSIDLGRFERLVRKGARSLHEYGALLESLGFDEPARAAMLELLQIQIDEDAQAAAERERAERELRPRGLSLEQLRRAVLLGARTVDDFQRFIVENRFTADAQEVLLAELRADLEDADAARRRREAAVPGREAPGLPLSTVRRAAALGVVAPATYAQRVRDAGYSDDDIAIELDLLVLEIAQTQAARGTRESAPAPSGGRGLSLGELERAVKAGVSSLDDYRARAVELLGSLDAADTVTAALQHELQTLTATRKRHDELAFTLAQQERSLKDLEASVTSGELAIDDYIAQLEAWDVDDADAELLGALLGFTIESKG